MKLRAKFEVLEKTAFGRWLAAFKKLFSVEELEQEIDKIQPDELKEYDKKISELNDEKMRLNYEANPYR